MTTISAQLPEELVERIRSVADSLGLSEAEIITRSLEAYLEQFPEGNDLDPVGFGMWADRSDMVDSAGWVRRLREREWQR